MGALEVYLYHIVPTNRTRIALFVLYPSVVGSQTTGLSADHHRLISCHIWITHPDPPSAVWLYALQYS